MRFLTFFYFSFLTLFSGGYSVVNASLFNQLPLPNFDVFAPRKSVQAIVDEWDGSRTWMTEGRAFLFDTETTGVTSGDRIVQISIYEMINGKFTGNTFNSYVNPCRSISQKAYEAHGLTADDLKNAPKFADIFDSLRSFCGENSILVAHNAQFDIRMLDQEIERLDGIEPWTVHIKCTLGMVRRDYTRKLKPALDIFSPIKRKTFKPVSYAERQKRLREKVALKTQKEWKKEISTGKKLQVLSQPKSRAERKEARDTLKRSREDMENQENMSPNSPAVDFHALDPNTVASDTIGSDSKRKRKTARPSFALSSVLGRLDTSPKRAISKHGYDLPKICEEHGVPSTRWNYHDALWDTAGLVGLMDSLSSSDSSQNSSSEIEDGGQFSAFNEEDDGFDALLFDNKDNEPFIIHSRI
ncbi:MAG: hypothetical protein GW748_06390 [Alphaproteobacteria bacterium]|nr:hypothetical protein [Alphaproteobacteria bacterium]NCQ67355.1 hypothetical protein [Alphaproteobacteria bacterium]NCT06678.1 hypothetical protein [Alphaproteobacteria bacterium]